MIRNWIPVVSTLIAFGCGEQAPVTPPKVTKKPAAETAPADAAKEDAESGEYVPLQEGLDGDPTLSFVLCQAWFTKDASGKPKPGPARMEIWRQGASGWAATRLEDGESNVFHKALFTEDGSLLTISGDAAALKRWTHADGKWTNETLWTQEWEGKFNRLRDIEIGDVDGDGKDEYVIATHDFGVIAVVNPDEGAEGVIELDKLADTFVHEIEIGDINGDGKLEFFATPTDRNKADASQKGMIAMYEWTGETYERTIVEAVEGTHAKEILVADIDGDGSDELFSVFEAEIGPDKKIAQPVTIRQYTRGADGSFSVETIASIDDRQTRFLLAGDFDSDGRKELVAAAMNTGLYLVDSTVADGKATWTATNFDNNSGGFEHATIAADLDGDGKLELVVAADKQRELKTYSWNAETSTFDKTLIGKLQPSTFTWNIAAGQL